MDYSTNLHNDSLQSTQASISFRLNENHFAKNQRQVLLSCESSMPDELMNSKLEASVKVRLYYEPTSEGLNIQDELSKRLHLASLNQSKSIDCTLLLSVVDNHLALAGQRL